MRLHFTDFFDVSPAVLDQYGAFDVSLLNDLPLFVDPFLLFNSTRPEYRELHEEIIRYMRFLREVSQAGEIAQPLLQDWFTFPEVKQNWLGFSLSGNDGHGLGVDFAKALHRNLRSVFSNFGDETVTRSSHIEKLCLVKRGVGRDNVSDFATNLIKKYLAEFTQSFAKAHIDERKRARFALAKTTFNYATRTWESREFDLPQFQRDFVLLTPRDILTKDEAWINRSDLLDSVQAIAIALPNEVLRAHVNEYLMRVIPESPKATRKDHRDAMARVVEEFPAILDYYVKSKEDDGARATSLAKQRVREVEEQFRHNVRQLVAALEISTAFYSLPGNTYDEARERLLYLKDVIENKGGHHLFYVDGKPIGSENDLQILYRMTWIATPSDVSREANDGRGPADFKISRGAHDKVLVEFKLASNTKLERNLVKQTPIYEKASDTTHPSLKAILYFSRAELDRVTRILKRLKLENAANVILIDARSDNKPSGSKA